MLLEARSALRFEPEWPEDWIAWALRAGVVGLGAAGFRADPSDTHPWLLPVTGLAALGAALVVAAVRTRRPRTMRLVEIAVLGAFAVHLSGHVFGFYQRPGFDTLLHASAAFAAGLAAFGLSQATEWFWRWEEETPARTFYFVLSFVALMVVGVEVGEFASDRALGTDEQTDPVQDPHTDTMIDLVAGIASGALAALAAALLSAWGRRTGFAKPVEHPKPAP